MNRSGFALIEAAIVVVALGLLATAVAPEVAARRERSLVATMRSDLLRFAAAQESYFYDHGVYAADVAVLVQRGYTPSAGVSLSIREATRAGFSVVASRVETRVRCFLFVREAAPVGSARSPGTVHCS